MPECYTYTHTAMQALIHSGHTVASYSAFRAGAVGFVPMYMYQLWQPIPRPDLPALATKMRHEKTGDFLLALIRYAVTSTQQSYVLGFLAHYATDCTLNPYITAMSLRGAPYGFLNGKDTFAAALDTQLYFQDYKTRKIHLHASTPVLITDELAQISSLLRHAIQDVYKKNLPQVALADAFHYNLFVRQILHVPFGKIALAFTNKTIKSSFGSLKYRTQKGKKLLQLPKKWANPYTKAQMDLSCSQLLTLAEQSAGVCVGAAMRYWLGTLEEENLAEVFRNDDYDTGLPCAQIGAERENAKNVQAQIPDNM